MMPLRVVVAVMMMLRVVVGRVMLVVVVMLLRVVVGGVMFGMLGVVVMLLRVMVLMLGLVVVVVVVVVVAALGGVVAPLLATVAVRARRLGPLDALHNGRVIARGARVQPHRRACPGLVDWVHPRTSSLASPRRALSRLRPTLADRRGRHVRDDHVALVLAAGSLDRTVIPLAEHLPHRFPRFGELVCDVA